jgi:pyruvate kinase
MRHTKIVATIGPSSSGEATLEQLLAAGVDVFRLNFSHGSHETHGEAITRIRRKAADAGRVVAILQDLGGPKIRTGPLQDGRPLALAAGDSLGIAVGDFPGGPGRISTGYAHLPQVVHRGDRLLLDDGRIELHVEASDGRELRTTVVEGGVLGEHTGINVPGVALPSAGLTPKDEADVRFGAAAGVDLVAMSFVTRVADLEQLRKALAAAGAPGLPVVAKLERPEAVERLDEILQASDAVMVARGDLGLELPLEQVPRVQKEATRRARALGIPVIIATQVFDSMRTEPRPTRAEVSDAANAVDDGADAIMLAGETAVGVHPVRAVQTLDRVIREAESGGSGAPVPLTGSLGLPEHGRAICEAAVTLAGRSRASAIVAVTRGGKTARALSALRPSVAIVAATDRPEIARRLALWRGVLPVVETLDGDVNAAAARIGQGLIARGIVAAGATLVLVSVTPDLTPGPSNVLTLHRA